MKAPDGWQKCCPPLHYIQLLKFRFGHEVDTTQQLSIHTGMMLAPAGQHRREWEETTEGEFTCVFWQLRRIHRLSWWRQSPQIFIKCWSGRYMIYEAVIYNEHSSKMNSMLTAWATGCYCEASKESRMPSRLVFSFLFYSRVFLSGAPRWLLVHYFVSNCRTVGSDWHKVCWVIAVCQPLVVTYRMQFRVEGTGLECFRTNPNTYLTCSHSLKT